MFTRTLSIHDGAGRTPVGPAADHDLAIHPSW
jgi:hypothetical protein